jgi:ArsR family transcriptional regulator
MKELARWLKATAEENRLRMLYLLSRHGELCVCDLQRALDISQSSASRHLRTLREAGLVADRRQGMWMHYTLIEADELRAGMLRELLTTLQLQGGVEELDRRLTAWLDTKLVDLPRLASGRATGTRPPAGPQLQGNDA